MKEHFKDLLHQFSNADSESDINSGRKKEIISGLKDAMSLGEQIRKKEEGEDKEALIERLQKAELRGEPTDKMRGLITCLRDL
ncbi:hypothetical protein BGX34_006973, partial [Mortierella sp. NVP85]